MPELLFALLRIALAVYLGVCLVVMLRQSSYVYYPARDVEGNPAVLNVPFQDLTLQTEDGERINAWFVSPSQNGGAGARNTERANGENPELAGLTILFCHGNAGNIGEWVMTAKMFHDMGLGFLVFDYRGFGRSTGKPTEEGTYRDAMAAWKYLTEQQKISPRRIVIHGWSLGGGPATWLAARVQPAALVLESVFTSAPDMAARIFPYLPARWLSRFRYDNLGNIRRVRCPILMAHSPEDTLIPFAMGRRVFEAASEPKRFVSMRGDHNGAGMGLDPEYREAFLDFLRSLPR